MAERVVTVSELRHACVDPEWRARWLAGEKPGTQSFGPGGQGPTFGALFHWFAEQFTDWLTGGGTRRPPARTPATGDALWGALHDRFAGPKLAELASQGKVPAAHRLSQSLRAFCHQLQALRARVPEFKSWQDVFLTHEFPLDRVPIEIEPGRVIHISGRPDAVRLAPEQGVEVIDYKLSRGGNLKQDLLQIAIYARLLRERKPGLQFSGVLEYYEPELHVVGASAGELESLFEEIVLPVLRECVPPTAPAPLPLPLELISPPESSDLGAAIQNCYADFNLMISVLGQDDAPQLTRYRVMPASGVKVSSLQSRAADLQVALGLDQPPVIRPGAGCVTIDLPKAQPSVVHWEEVMRRPDLPAAPLAFPIGIGMDGTLLSGDLAEPTTCHLLVAGTSGSGKSEFLKTLVATLAERNQPELLRLTLVDPKGVTFSNAKGASHLADGIISDLALAVEMLEEAVKDMDARYRALWKATHESIAERGVDKEMPYRVIVFDEFSDLVLAGKNEREQFEMLLTRLAQKGRAAGIHLVLATQRPDAKVVTGLVKSNLPLRVCFRVTSDVNSRIVLGDSGAERLLGKGDLLCDRGRGLERAQAALLPKSPRP